MPDPDNSSPDGILRVRMGAQDTTYRSVIIPAARLMGYFADCITQINIEQDGVSSLLAAYEGAQFKKPVHIGDFLEFQGRLIGRGNRSRRFAMTAIRHIRAPGPGEPEKPAAVVIKPPEIVAEAVIVVVLHKQ